MINCGVYEIICEVNSKRYIGSSCVVEWRIKKHFNQLRLGKHHNKELQADFILYGENKFTADLVEKCKNENEARRKESLFISSEEKLKLYNKSYITFDQPKIKTVKSSRKWMQEQFKLLETKAKDKKLSMNKACLLAKIDHAMWWHWKKERYSPKMLSFQKLHDAIDEYKP